MLHRLALVATVAVLPALAFAAEKAAVKRPAGTFSREVGDRKVTFAFQEDTLTITVKLSDSSSVTIDAAYGVTADGVLFATMTKVEKKGTDGGPNKGDLFSFQYALGKGELKLSDLKGTAVDDESRKLTEGTYKQEK